MRVRRQDGERAALDQALPSMNTKTTTTEQTARSQDRGTDRAEPAAPPIPGAGTTPTATTTQQHKNTCKQYSKQSRHRFPRWGWRF